MVCPDFDPGNKAMVRTPSAPHIFNVRLQMQELVHANNNMTNRIESLDWLRGLMALAIVSQLKIAP